MKAPIRSVHDLFYVAKVAPGPGYQRIAGIARNRTESPESEKPNSPRRHRGTDARRRFLGSLSRLGVSAGFLSDSVRFRAIPCDCGDSGDSVRFRRSVQKVLPVQRIATLRDEAGVADHSAQLFLGRTVGHTSGPDDVLFKHY